VVALRETNNNTQIHLQLYQDNLSTLKDMHFSKATFAALVACAATSFVVAQDTTPTQSKDAFDKATVSLQLGAELRARCHAHSPIS